MASARDARRGGGGGGVWSLFRSKYLYLYAFGSFSNGLFISLRGPIIPELARRVGREPAALGTYLGLGGVSGGVFALPTGYFLDRVDAHAVFITGSTGCGLCGFTGTLGPEKWHGKEEQCEGPMFLVLILHSQFQVKQEAVQ